MALSHPPEQDEERGVQLFNSRSLVVLPIASAAEMMSAIRAYEDIKSSILLKRDTVRISGEDHVKKSGWLRIARAFGVSCFAVSSTYVTDQDAHDWGYEVVVRAMAPNGAEMQGDGACWASEKASAQRTKHNVRAHAFTRATNRAISNLVGGGEVSAEELSADYVDADDDAHAPIPAPAQRHIAPPVQPMQPQQQRQSTAPARRKDVSWSVLAMRAGYIGISSPSEWSAYCRGITGKEDAKDYTPADKAAVLADIEKLERADADAKAQQEAPDGDAYAATLTYTDDPDAPVEHDLRGVTPAAHGAN